MTRIRFGAFGAALILMSATAAQAAAKRVGIPKFDGKQEALVRKNVMKALKAHGFELVKSREMEDAISSSGAHLDSDDGLKTLAKELALSAIITGEVGPRRAKIVVHDGAEGSVLGDASFAGANPRKLSTEVGRDFWRKLGADIGRGQVPKGAKKPQKSAASEAPEDNEESSESGDEAAAKPKAEPAAESSEATPEAAPARNKKKPKMETPPEETAEAGTPTTLPWIDIFVGVGGLNRSLSYHQDINNSLFPYSLGLGPEVLGKLVVYPLQAIVPGTLDGLGVEAGIEQAVNVSSQTANGSKYTNVVHEFDAGLRYRIPFGVGNDLYFSGTGGEHAFTFSSSTPADRINLRIPDTIYHYIRPGAGARFTLPNSFSVSVAAGYRYIFNKAGSQITSDTFFPHLTVAGADAEVEVGYTINQYFEARVGAEWRRYWFNMHSQATDMSITGGAVDQYFTFTAGLAFMYGGGEPRAAAGGGGDEAPPPPPPPKPNAGRRHSSDSDSDEKTGGDSDSGAGKTGGNDE